MKIFKNVRTFFLLSLVLFGGLFIDASARSKPVDDEIKSTMNGLRGQAELYYDEKPDQGYEGFCTSSSSSRQIEYAKNQANHPVVCVDSNKEWAIEVEFRIQPGFYCVDSTGQVNTNIHSSNLSEKKMVCDKNPIPSNNMYDNKFTTFFVILTAVLYVYVGGIVVKRIRFYFKNKK